MKEPNHARSTAPDSRRGAFWPKKCDSNQSAERIFDHTGRMWNPIASAPPGRNLELAVIDDDGVHALVFPCEKAPVGWKNVATGARVDIRPTHWRVWNPEEHQLGFLQNPH
ncbi:hypothetical protein [Mesorhizobium sp.]|uniref:hypothetical protein n=1 Tax=Mesorhizobium sp. TaxID=1871066 RepID=UPI00342BEC7E